MSVLTWDQYLDKLSAVSFNKEVKRDLMDEILRKEDHLQPGIQYYVVDFTTRAEEWRDIKLVQLHDASHLQFRDEWILTRDKSTAYFVDQEDAIMFLLAYEGS